MFSFRLHVIADRSRLTWAYVPTSCPGRHKEAKLSAVKKDCTGHLKMCPLN